jgi:ABC-type uncharacterized transport system permease subunit
VTPLFWAAALLYAGAAALYFGFVVGLPDRLASWARGAIGLGFILNLCEIGARGVAGLHPVSSVRETIGFLAWVAVGVFLFMERKRHLPAVGAVVAPGALVLLLAARLTPVGDDSNLALGVVGRVHILLAALGISVFAVAAASAILYLLEERQLKRRRLTNVVKRGAALETLDGVAHRCVQVGFPIFSVALIAGVLWSAQISSNLRPEHVIAAVAWAAFAVVLVARMTAGWRGRRAASITVFGFAATLVVLAFYLVRAVT